jgi:hypothetical protein
MSLQPTRAAVANVREIGSRAAAVLDNAVHTALGTLIGSTSLADAASTINVPRSVLTRYNSGTGRSKGDILLVQLMYASWQERTATTRSGVLAKTLGASTLVATGTVTGP